MNQNLIFRLPQSLIRSFGIKDIANFNFFQTNFTRNSPQQNNVAEIEMGIYNLNSIIIGSLTGKKSNLKFINLLDEKLIYPINAVVDYNLITSSEINRGLKQIKNLTILPYDSLVLNPKFEDIRYLKSFLKSTKDCYFIWKKSKAKFCYNWIDMITLNDHKTFLPWFWKPKELSLNLYLTRIRDVALSLSNEFEFMNNFHNCVNPILIQYTEYKSEMRIQNQLDNLFNLSAIFRDRIRQPGAEIFLKPHRTNMNYEDNNLTRFKGIKINRPISIEENFIPSEVFINSRNSNLLLISEWSSSLFNFQIKDIIPIKYDNLHDLILKDFHRLRMSLSRLAKFRNLESFFT